MIFSTESELADSILNSTDSIRRKTDPNAPDGERFLHCDDPIQAVMVLLRTGSHYLARAGAIVDWFLEKSIYHKPTRGFIYFQKLITKRVIRKKKKGMTPYVCL